MTFYFYDLETTGFSPRSARIMQFAGQRTDEKLQPIGKPHNFLIRLSEDVLPDPDAVLITGITPQKVNQEGITEAEFLKIFHKEIAIKDTTFVGFNSIRFDDEFMRFLQYRNFYDAYEWQWKNGRSRWDLLDVVRMTRALRPEGIKWPVDSAGQPANRLTLLTSINKLTHANAHDALSDVLATIDLARLIYKKQPDLFRYLLKMRDKKAVEQLVMAGKPFVYTSGRFPSEFEKTTVATTLTKHPSSGAALVYDLRHNPTPFFDLSSSDLVAAWVRRHDEEGLHLPVKTLKYNRCPAVAPLSVLDESSQKRLNIDLKSVEANQKLLESNSDFVKHLLEALKIMEKQTQTRFLTEEKEVDAQLYDDFVSDQDKRNMAKVISAPPNELGSLSDSFKDSRLKALLPLYKARNFPSSLTPEEKSRWEQFCFERLFAGEEKSRAASYLQRIEELRTTKGTTQAQQHLLTDLELYVQSLMPTAY